MNRERDIIRSLERIIAAAETEKKETFFQSRDEHGIVALEANDIHNVIQIMESYIGDKLPAVPEDEEARRTLAGVISAMNTTMRDLMRNAKDEQTRERFEHIVEWTSMSKRVLDGTLPDISEEEQAKRRQYHLKSHSIDDIPETVPEEESVFILMDRRTGLMRVLEGGAITKEMIEKNNIKPPSAKDIKKTLEGKKHSKNTPEVVI